LLLEQLFAEQGEAFTQMGLMASEPPYFGNLNSIEIPCPREKQTSRRGNPSVSDEKNFILKEKFAAVSFYSGFNHPLFRR
jgi:hypothetical protein